MLDVDDILIEWKKDGNLDPLTLSDQLQQCASLFSKYSYYAKQTTVELYRAEVSLNKEIVLINRYLNGKMQKDEMDQFDLPYDPFNGEVVLKTDIKKHVDLWPSVVAAKNKVKVLEQLESTLKDIIGQIRFRPQAIKTMLEIQKFNSGA